MNRPSLSIRIPTSITSLKVFEVAARHLSFSRAAEELYITQSAVSKQIRSLEEQLEVVLFVRCPQGLVLTDAGHFYVDAIRPILEQLTSVTCRLRDFTEQSDVLNLRAPCTVSQRWLIPRLVSFTRMFRDMKVNLVPRGVSDAEVRLDAEIFSTEGAQRVEATASYLIGGDYVVVCSPGLYERLKPNPIENLLDQTLIAHVRMASVWHDWFAAAGRKRELAARPDVSISFWEQFSVMIPGLMEGMGVGILPLFLVLDEVRSGQLVIPVQPSIAGKGYSLTFREEKRFSPTLQRFLEWLLGEAEKTERECQEITAQNALDCGSASIAC